MKHRAAVLAGIDRGRPLVGPAAVHLDIVNACNTDCITCWDHSPLLAAPRPVEWKRRRMEASRAEAVLDDLLSLGGLEEVVVSGQGEPFTHPDVARVLRAVTSRGLRLVVITNLVAADAHVLAEATPHRILAGVHAASEESYLAFHPSFDAQHWQRLHSRLSALAAAGVACRHVHVICRVNAHELVAMVEQAARTGADGANFKLASLTGGTEGAGIDARQRALLAHELVPRAMRRARELGVATNLGLFARQLEAGGEATAPIEEIGCFAGFAYARVTVDGTVLYCCNTALPVGALDAAGIASMWAADAWNALRDRLRAGRYAPGCDRCGKLDLNVKLGRAFAKAYGETRRLEVTGRGAP